MADATIQGTVTDSNTGLPIQGATISSNDGAGNVVNATSNASGNYSMIVQASISQFTGSLTTNLLFMYPGTNFNTIVELNNNDSFYVGKTVYYRVKFTRENDGTFFHSYSRTKTYTSSPQSFNINTIYQSEITRAPGRYIMNLEVSLVSDFSVLESASITVNNDIFLIGCGSNKTWDFNTTSCKTSTRFIIAFNVTGGVFPDCLIGGASISLTGPSSGNGATFSDGNAYFVNLDPGTYNYVVTHSLGTKMGSIVLGSSDTFRWIAYTNCP